MLYDTVLSRIMISTKQITPTQQAFVNAYLATGNLSEAVRIAFPVKSLQWSQDYIALKGHRMSKQNIIRDKIMNRRAIMEANADLAASKIQTIIRGGEDNVALKASMFAIEQVDGRATQVVETTSKAITLNIDLSGNGLPDNEAIESASKAFLNEQTGQ